MRSLIITIIFLVFSQITYSQDKNSVISIEFSNISRVDALREIENTLDIDEKNVKALLRKGKVWSCLE